MTEKEFLDQYVYSAMKTFANGKMQDLARPLKTQQQHDIKSKIEEFASFLDELPSLPKGSESYDKMFPDPIFLTSDATTNAILCTASVKFAKDKALDKHDNYVGVFPKIEDDELNMSFFSEDDMDKFRKAIQDIYKTTPAIPDNIEGIIS